MSFVTNACIAGIYEHPLRVAPDHTVAQLHAEVAHGALLDAGLTLNDVDAYFCAGDAPGMGAVSMADYLGLKKVKLFRFDGYRWFVLSNPCESRCACHCTGAM
jgi:acetyl-CoA C-acetyltransferase